MKIDGREIESGILDIPEGKSGNFQIKHDYKFAGETMPLINSRSAMFSGGNVKNIQFQHQTRWHKLLEDGGIWTTDWPIEQYQQVDCVKGFNGVVLLSGLGVGLVPAVLSNKNIVKRIVVVELNKDVIKLVAPHMSKKVEVINADIFDYLKTTKEKFDCVFHDIWTSDGEHTFATVVIPLRELTRKIGVPDSRITCWNENVMIGQLVNSLINSMLFPEIKKRLIEDFKKKKGTPFAGMKLVMPVYEWMVKSKPNDETYQRMARYYGSIVGKKNWLKKWKKKISKRINDD